MGDFNKIKVSSVVKNTGVGEAFFDPANIKAVFLVPLKKVFTQTEFADANILSTLNTLVRAARATRIFPVQNLNNLTDNSEDDVSQTFGYGDIEPVRDGDYSWIFGFRVGGLPLATNLRSFNGLVGKYGAIFVDANNQVMANKGIDGNGADGYAPVRLKVLKSLKWKANDGATNTGYGLQVSFAPEQINADIAYTKVDPTVANLLDIYGLQDVVLTQKAAPSGHVYTVLAETPGGENMAESYGGELDVAGAWVAKNKTTGAAITISGVAVTGDGKGFAITLDDTDADYPASTGTLTIEMASPAALYALGVVNYESNVLTQTRP